MKPIPVVQAETVAARVTTGLSKIGLALKTQAWQRAEKRGLSPTQGQVLAYLGGHEGARLSDVAAALGVSPPTTSDSVRVLVEKGLVRKKTERGDARAVGLSLTAVGKREAQQAASWPDFLMHAVSELTDEEQRVFLIGLTKMIRTLQERGQIPVNRMCVSCTYFQPHVHESTDAPHHCAFVDEPFGDGHLRLDCADQRPADADLAAANWLTFTRRAPSPA